MTKACESVLDYITEYTDDAAEALAVAEELETELRYYIDKKRQEARDDEIEQARERQCGHPSLSAAERNGRL